MKTFEKASEIAKAMEMTEENGHQCRPAASNAPDERQGMVNKVLILTYNRVIVVVVINVHKTGNLN